MVAVWLAEPSKLQNALSSLERFSVVLSHSSRSSSGGARLSSGLGASSRPFKLCLCRAHDEKSLRDYSSNVLLFDPLASLTAVEDFLWPRVQHSKSSHKSSTSVENSGSGNVPSSTPASATRRHSTRSRSSVNVGTATEDLENKDFSMSSMKLKSGDSCGIMSSNSNVGVFLLELGMK